MNRRTSFLPFFLVEGLVLLLVVVLVAHLRSFVERAALPEDVVPLAPDETTFIILRALLLAGAGFAALSLALPVSIGLAVLLGVVALSYRMIVVAYPTGGGSYSVSKANLGRIPSLVAASALLMGYVLTVAVSVSTPPIQNGASGTVSSSAKAIRPKPSTRYWLTWGSSKRNYWAPTASPAAN